MREVEPQHRVARLEQPQIHRRVGLRTGVRLDIGELGPKQLLGAVAGQVFNHVDVLAPAVVTSARITLGVFVGQHATDRLHHRRAGVVFAGNHFEPVLLALDFAGDGGPQLGVLGFDEIHARRVILCARKGRDFSRV